MRSKRPSITNESSGGMGNYGSRHLFGRNRGL